MLKKLHFSCRIASLTGKLIKKKHKKKTFFEWQEIGITSLWEEVDDKLLTPGQLLGRCWLLWCITVQTSYWDSRWHQNWVRSRPQQIFCKWQWKILKNGRFYSSASSSKSKKRVIVMRPTGKWLLRIEQQTSRWQRLAAGLFYCVFSTRNWEMPVERELAEKLGNVAFKEMATIFKNQPSHWMSGIKYISRYRGLTCGRYQCHSCHSHLGFTFLSNAVFMNDAMLGAVHK